MISKMFECFIIQRNAIQPCIVRWDHRKWGKFLSQQLTLILHSLLRQTNYLKYTYKYYKTEKIFTVIFSTNCCCQNIKQIANKFLKIQIFVNSSIRDICLKNNALFLKTYKRYLYTVHSIFRGNLNFPTSHKITNFTA